MNPFYEAFPKTVLVGGDVLPIKTDFRAVLRVLDVLNDQKLSAEGKLEAVLGLYKEPPKDLIKAVNAVADFIMEPQEEETEDDQKKRKKCISYRKDAPYIAGDFLRFYGIDLTSCDYLHWKKFQLLLQGLSSDSETKTRISYRLVDTAKIRNKEERARINRIQRAIAIEDTEVDAEDIGAMFDSLE